MTGECYGKRAYDTYWQANRSAKKLNRKHEKAKANVYQCPSCHTWHIGNTMHGDIKKEEYKRNKYVSRVFVSE